MTDKKNLQSPEFISLADAAEMKNGTRVTFVPGVQALYAEALKNICYVKKIPIIRVLHPLMGIDKETGEDRQAQLFDLTCQTSLPTMLHDEERPRNVWIEQLALAEEIGDVGSPSLIPDKFELRVEMFGLCAVVLAEDGLVWNIRILNDSPLGRKYGYSEEASSTAPAKIAEVIGLIDGRLEAQEKLGSRYLVGDSLTAVDIYWATLSMSALPVPPEIMPKTQQNQGMLMWFEGNSKMPEIAEALTQRVEDHQRYILTTYCETPAVLGGDPLPPYWEAIHCKQSLTLGTKMTFLSNLSSLMKLPAGWWKKIVLFGLAAFFINVGVDHFVNPEFYLSIMPPAFPLHLEAVYISGFFEVLGGVGVLIPRLRKIAGWGLVALLVAVYPANIYMAITPEAFPEASVALLYVRLAFQFLFFYWAFSVTRPAYNGGDN